MSQEIRSSEVDFDVEAALSAFLADTNETELQLPALDTEQRKKAKKLAEEYPEIKCESYGFGPERRLHLFKQGVAKTKESDSKKESLTGQFASEGSTAVSGVTSSEEKQDSPASDEGAAMALPTPGYQIRNTFIHINEGPGTDVVDQRAVQSMPHGMFSQCLQEEKENAPSPIIGSDSGSTKEITEPARTLPAEAPKEMFAPGTEVVIEGLTKYPGFNGLHGTVQSLDQETGRYNVQLSSADGSNGQRQNQGRESSNDSSATSTI